MTLGSEPNFVDWGKRGRHTRAEDKVSLTASISFSLHLAPMLENKLENDWGNIKKVMQTATHRHTQNESMTPP